MGQNIPSMPQWNSARRGVKFISRGPNRELYYRESTCIPIPQWLHTPAGLFFASERCKASMAAPATIDDLIKLIRNSGMVVESKHDAYIVIYRSGFDFTPDYTTIEEEH